MLAKRTTKAVKTLIALGLSGALVAGGMPASTAAKAAETSFLEKCFAAMQTRRAAALDSVSANTPTSSVEQTEEPFEVLPQRGYTLEDALGDGQVVDAEEYCTTLGEEVAWNTCNASTYGVGDGLMGSTCADGSKVTADSMGVAHKTLPFGTVLQINCNGKVVEATVVDRGPYVSGRELDLQPAVAEALGFEGVGTLDYRIVE